MMTDRYYVAGGTKSCGPYIVDTDGTGWGSVCDFYYKDGGKIIKFENAKENAELICTLLNMHNWAEERDRTRNSGGFIKRLLGTKK